MRTVCKYYSVCESKHPIYRFILYFQVENCFNWNVYKEYVYGVTCKLRCKTNVLNDLNKKTEKL